MSINMWYSVKIMTHGKRSSYNRGCRCYPCTRANTTYINKNNYQHKERNQVRTRRNVLAKKYGITIEQYDEMFKNQSGNCAICGIPQPMSSRNASLVIDHCHSTNKVRGLLCDYCNSGLGFFKDDIKRLESAIKYITLHST